MSADRVLFTGLPAILTLAIHGGLVLMLVVRWTGPSEVIAAAPSIQPIQASLIQAETLKPKPKPKPKPNQSRNLNQSLSLNPRLSRLLSRRLSPNPRKLKNRSLRWMQRSWRR